MKNIKIISASAGTGKTYRLAELLHGAIEGGQARPEAVVATTFTNKAAAELRERVRRRLLSGGLTDDARMLAAARIGTVNSICGQLVSDFAFELGLPPDLRVLDEAEATVELGRALSSVLDDDRLRELGDLEDRMVEFDWKEDVRCVLGRARENNLGRDALLACAERSIELFDEVLEDPKDKLPAESLEKELEVALSCFLTGFAAIGDTTDKSRKVLNACRAASDRLNFPGTLPWDRWLSLAGQEPGTKSRDAFEPVRSVAERHCLSARLRTDCHGAIRAVFELAAEALKRYADHKAEMGAIDFVDQEVRALEVLGRPDLVERLRGSIDLVLVDEFQDTSPLQLAVFLALADLAPRSVWVGDQKQAIFGFRGTDPALMDAAIATILEGGEPDTLKTSYRSRRELVAMTSDVFVRPFVARGIPESRVRIVASDPGEHAGLCSSVELWQLKSGNQTDDAAAVAAGVRDLLESGLFRIRDRDREGGSRPVRAGDVVVLCRKNDTCVKLAAQLALVGVRASVERAGLFSTPEARVLLAGLRLWADSWCSLARAELARLIGYPEDAGAWLEAALDGAGGSGFESVGEIRLLERARYTNPLAGAMEAFELTVEALDLRNLCRSWGDAPERLANLEAVRAHAVGYADRAWSEGRAATPWGLVAYLEQVQEDDRDGRPANAGTDAVTVSTWHGAKGLEWPVVVLLDTEQTPEPSPFGVHVESDRSDFDLSNPLDGRWVRYWPNPYLRAQKKARLHARAGAHDCAATASVAAASEHLRLDYVGWTRARDCVVLASRAGGRESGLPGRLSTSERVIGLPEIGDDDEFVMLDWAASPVRAGVRRCAPAQRRPRDAEPGSAYVAAGPREFASRWVQPHAIREGVDASGDGGPAMASVGAAAGSESGSAEGAIESIGERIALSGAGSMDDVGSAVHGFLAADRPGLSREERLAIASGLLDRWQVAGLLSAESLLAAGDALRNWVEGRWPGAVWHREMPMLHRLPTGSTVRGACDLALETPAGWVIIDHKSFPGGAEQAIARAETHAPQLSAYAAAIRAATNKPILGCWIHLPVTGLVVELPT